MPGAIEDFDNIRFGGPTVPDEFTVEVTVSPVRVLKNDPDRLMVVATNNNVPEVYWSTLPDVNAIDGFAIGNGIVLQLIVQNDGALCGKDIWMMSPGGPVDVQIIILRRQRRG